MYSFRIMRLFVRTYLLKTNYSNYGRYFQSKYHNFQPIKMTSETMQGAIYVPSRNM